jgi:signal transduction histidine kinase
MTQSENDIQGPNRDYEIDVLSGCFSGALTLVLLIRDVTHRNYIKMLKKQNRHKSDTLSFVSHEYRTPLNCIIEMLKSALDFPERNLIKCALDNSKYLSILSNDLLDHA